MEIESALVSHPKVAEAAVVGKPHLLKGQALVAYVVLKGGEVRTDPLREELREHVRHEIGAIAVPDELFITDKLRKTRSGKIMRRVIRSLVSGQRDRRHGDARGSRRGRRGPEVARGGRGQSS